MNKNNLCNNCGKQGHQFHQCKLPITSYGLIVFTLTHEGIKYLMIRRKDSFGYIDFIRGKYVLNNIEHLQAIFNEMSVDERNKINNETFDKLWKDMWGKEPNELSSQYKVEEIHSRKKFESLKNGINIGKNGEMINLQKLIDNAQTSWSEPEWEFSKGRRNHQEKEIDCALREFEEETGINKTNIKVIENIIPFEEIFIGSNHKSYKHKYFLGFVENNDFNLSKYQYTEVSKVEWKTIDECIDSIRPYNNEKKTLILNINKSLKEYRLY
jgi:8-oxo-dGTP pyrophosphatase MutT (NUDIX family)